MVSNFMNITEDNIQSLKQDILDGKPISNVNCSILASFLGGVINENEERKPLSKIIELGNRGELKNCKKVIGVLDSLERWYKYHEPIVYMNAYNNSVLSAKGITCVVKGQSGKIYNAEIIDDIDTILTSNVGAVKLYNTFVENGVNLDDINPLQCFVEGSNQTEVLRIIDSTTLSDYSTSSMTFESPMAMIDFLGKSRGFIIKVKKRVIIVFERYDINTDKKDAAIFVNLVGSNQLQEVRGAGMIFKIFE